MLIDAAHYVDGRRQPEVRTLADIASAASSRTPDDLIWIGLRMPTDDELATLQQAFTLSDHAVREARDVHERPKLERDGATLLLVLRTARYVIARDETETGELCVFVTRGTVLTIRHGNASALGDVRSRLEGDPTALRAGTSAVLHAICERVVGDYQIVVDRLIKDVRQVEREVFSESRGQPIRRIYFLIREVLELLTVTTPLAAPLVALGEPGCGRWVDEAHASRFVELRDDLLRVIEDVRTLETLLMSALNAAQTEVAIRQNEDMRRISAWVAIASVPTMVAGIYGMNFEHIPELGTRYGYFVVLALLAVACVALHRRFKASGWL